MTETITSRHNPRIKTVAKLRDRRGRREQQRIIVDGVREIRRALDAGVSFEVAFVCDSILDQSGNDLRQQLEISECELVCVNEPVMEKIAFGNRAEGIVAIAEPPVRTLADLPLTDPMLVAVLENVEKPGNIGAVLRSADAAGLSAVIVADGGTDLFNPNAIRSSAGTLFSMPVVACSSDEALSWLQEQAFQIYATRVDGAVDYTKVSYSGRSAIILGSEVDGLSKKWQVEGITSVLLPMCGVGDSLNVSVTAAVLFYEAMRQRTTC